MAPRGRGSSGGAGGDGDGGGFSNSLWAAPYSFEGSHFKDPIARATIILDGIFFLMLIAIAIWSAGVRTSSDCSRQVFKWHRFGISMFAAVIWFGIRFASAIIRDVVNSVETIYLLIEDILGNFAYVAQIFLLATVYCLFAFCHRRSIAKPYRQFMTWIHAGICTILFGLWVAILYFYISFDVHYILENQDPDKLLRTLDTAAKINIAFSALFLCAAIEVLAWAVAIQIGSLKTMPADKVGILSITLIGIPLLIYALWDLVISSRQLHHITSSKVLLAYIIFRGLTILAAYGGVVAIAIIFEIQHEQNITNGAFMPLPLNQPNMQWQPQPPYPNMHSYPHGFNGGPPPPPPPPPLNSPASSTGPKRFFHQQSGRDASVQISEAERFPKSNPSGMNTVTV